MPTLHRRDFLKGLGALALACLPACRRAQETIVAPEDCPEWMRVGERMAYSSCMPWGNGAFPLLAACHGGLPTSLQPHPRAAQRGLPAFVQASILDLYDPTRAAEPTFNGAPFPWRGVQGALRAWSRALKEGRRTGILFPCGWSPLRQAQVAQLQAAAPALRCFAWDPAAEPRQELPDFPELQRQQDAALGTPARWETGFGTLGELTCELPQLELLFILTPADPAAHDKSFADALHAATAETLRLHLRADATATLCAYTLPQTHFLEEWGAEADAKGNLCLRQPLTYPLRPALAEAELLHALLHDGELPFAPEAPASGERRFPALDLLATCLPAGTGLEQALRRGVLEGAAPQPSALPPFPRAEGSSTYLHPLWVDGRFAHNAWLRETYDTLSGAAGAPAAFLSGEKVAHGSVQVNGTTLPACRVPGLRAPLLPQLLGLSATTELHWQAETPFPLRQPAPAPELRYAAPEAPQGDASPQWGMVIDLAACIGCNACTLACRAENNIPTVGAEEQRKGRDLQWLRLERSLRADGTTAFFRPAACRQCEDAPCEKVCPVNATVHTSEGLNAMVYPRCWGTRYCAAACPYNARRFNFFDYAKRAGEATPLPPNPRVTVRSRGVMEACTYCVQRLNAAQAAAAVSGSPLEAPAPAPACAEACPTGAIRLLDLCRTPYPEREKMLTSFDAPHTRPRTRYVYQARF